MTYKTTPEGLEKMKKELEEAENVKAPLISERIAKAKEHGDLSENAEYHDAKDAMGWLMGRANELRNFIANAVVIEPNSSDGVTVGCKVTCEVRGKERIFYVVGSNETDPGKGRISDQSPLGKALFGRKVGDTFEFEAPAGSISYIVKEITC